ncbi:MAG: ABC transporter ATP-binding protein [Chloroflexota bacterium]
MTYLLRLRIFIKPYFQRIALNLLLLLGITGLALVVPRIIQDVIDIGLAQKDVDYLARAGLVLFGLGLATAVLSLFHRYLSEWIAAHIGYDLRNRMYDHIQYLPFTYHDHSQTGQLISRCIEDVRAIERLAGSSLVELVQLLLMALGILVIMVGENARLAVISLLPLVPMLFLTVNFGERVSAFFLAVDNALGDLSARLQENVTGVQVIRAFAREPYEIERFDQGNRNLFKARITVIGEWSKVMPTTQLLITAGTVLVLWFGGQMVLDGTMTVGEVVAFNSYLLMLAAPVQQLTWLVNALGEAAAGAQRVFDVLDTQPAIQTPAGAVGLSTLRGQVEFRDVGLFYEGEPRPALESVSQLVEPNQIVALMGQTGSGKTSLVNLIPRFYDVSQGAVLVDGQDVRTVDLLSLRRQIGIVLQTSLLFSDTIKANIAYGKPDASDEEIVAAARAAQAHEFITGFPEGYGTIIGERGVTLSGGQRQRVAIARALLMDPRILILDDSTSSVDTQTEQLIQQALDKLMEGRTTFVIAHRLSTVRRADLILVMDEGRIVQRGTHEQLLAEGGLYREIYELQLLDHARFAEEMEELDLSVPAPYRGESLG